MLPPLRSCRLWLLLLPLAASGTPPQFPRRFSANVVASGNFEQVHAVYQDLDGQRKLLAGELTGDVSHGGWRQQSLLTKGPTGADPSTPYASSMVAMSWQSGSAPPARCSYELALDCVKRDPNSGGCIQHAPASVTPFFGNPVTTLEKREAVDGVMCEKWSNNGSATAPPWTEYLAIWFAADSLSIPRGPTVAKVQIINPGNHGGFPTPGWTASYALSNFSTAPIASSTFAPPAGWLQSCTNSDDDVVSKGVPGRQSGYLCVSPDKDNSFSLALKAKPEKDATVHLNVEHCGSGDYCIDGKHCKDCVKITSGVTFTSQDWATPKIVNVSYVSSGDSQFKITSPDYFIKSPSALQFSTCACRGGEVCSNECNRFCGPAPPPPPTPKPGQVACYCAPCGSFIFKDFPKGTTCAPERAGCGETSGSAKDGCYGSADCSSALGGGALCHCPYSAAHQGYCSKATDRDKHRQRKTVGSFPNPS